MKVCLQCFAIYDADLMPSTMTTVDGAEGCDTLSSPCLIKGCIGQIVDIDESIYPAIAILNFKGFATKFCCAGHVYDILSETYVLFESKEPFSEIPSRFIQESEDTDGLMLRCEHQVGDRLISIQSANHLLYEWAKSLPDQNEEFRSSWSELDWRSYESQLFHFWKMGIYPYTTEPPQLIARISQK